MTMRIVQLSDTHIVEPGELLNGIHDTASRLALTVAAIEGLHPDLVLLTGDLVDAGSREQYEHLRGLLAPLTAPMVLLPGNHDDPQVLADAFGLPPTFDRVLAGEVTVVTLDSSRRYRPHGELSSEQLNWLAATLEQLRGPVLVALHHPPFVTGVDHMDAMRLDAQSSDRLASVIMRYPEVQRVVCGHLHRHHAHRFAGTVAMSCPATAPAIGPQPWPVFIDEPPACLLHVWNDRTGMATSMISIGSFDEWTLAAIAGGDESSYGETDDS
jgi:3',5'-cyclic-AMP phosphodiesterase